MSRMNRRDWLLLAVAQAGDNGLSPIQIQKTMFLLRMEAGNLFVRWFAPEIDLVFADDDDRRFLESRGLLPVKVPRGDEWEDLVGRLVWEH